MRELDFSALENGFGSGDSLTMNIGPMVCSGNLAGVRREKGEIERGERERERKREREREREREGEREGERDN